MIRNVTNGTLLIIYLFVFDYTLEKIKNTNFDRNQDGFDLEDGMLFIFSLMSLVSSLFIVLKSGISLAENAYSFWNRANLKIRERKEKHLENLEKMFDDLSQENKEYLYRKNLAEKDCRGAISLKYICPITKSLIIDPVYLIVFPDDIKRRYKKFKKTTKDHSMRTEWIVEEYKKINKSFLEKEVYDSHSLTNWRNLHPDFKRSIATFQPLLDNKELRSPYLTQDHAEYFKELEDELNRLTPSCTKSKNAPLQMRTG